MEIGQKVRVVRVRDRVSSDFIAKVKASPVGTILGYKVLDGKEIGVIVKLSESFSTWFFEDELQAEG